MFMFLLCSLCCKCCASSINKTDDHEHERNLEKGCCCKSNCCRKCMYMTNFVILTGMVVLLILWFLKFKTAINSIDNVYCGTSTIFNSILNGMFTTEFQFAGLNGFKFLIQSTLTEVESTLSSPEPQNILDRAIATNIDAMVPSLLTFYNDFKDYTVKDPVNGATDLKSVSVQQLTTQINEAIGTEYD